MGLEDLPTAVTRTEDTIDEYRKRVEMLTGRAEAVIGRPATILETIQYLNAQHGEYRPASLRKYFAALTMAVDQALADGTLHRSEELVHREALADRPRPRPNHAEKRTSAKKRKAVSKTEVKVVCQFLWQRGKDDDRLLVSLISHGVFLGLRPSEYLNADRQGAVLVVQNCKTTNGRGLGDFRELNLADVSADQMTSLDRLIADFAAASAGDLERLIDRLGARLRRACACLGIEPFALYTTRHQAIANLKAAGKSAAEIAAMAGHWSLRTAGRHYAHRGSGWKMAPTVQATQRMVAKFDERLTRPKPSAPKI